MGCDIHTAVERRRKDGWHTVKFKQECWACYAKPPVPHCAYCRGKGYNHELNFWDDRDYRLFAILANVRNGSEDPFESLAPNRGVPSDASKVVKATVKQWGPDGHSHTWISLEELLHSDFWKKTSDFVGYVNASAYTAFANGDREFSFWSEREIDVSRWTIIPEEQMRLLIARPTTVVSELAAVKDALAALATESPAHQELLTRFTALEQEAAEEAAKILVPCPDTMLTKVEWTRTYEDLAGEFLLDARRDLVKLGKPGDVRIVMWFDN